MAHYAHTEEGFVGNFQGGVGWYCYPTRRFKTITLHAFWVNDLVPGETAMGALLPHVLRRGTRRWPSLVAIERELENLYGAGFRADIGKVGDKQLLSFHMDVIHGQFLPGHPDTLARALDFMTEVTEHPHLGAQGFDEDVVQQEKELLKRQIQALVNDKGQYALSRLIEVMAQGRRFGLRKLGTVEEVEKVTGPALTRYYQQVKQTRPVIFLVVGDVDPATIEAYVHDRWGDGGRAALPPIEPFVLQHQGQEVVERQPIRQGKVNLGYATGLTASDPAYPALMMYAGVLGGFPHSKLFMNVRERASLAYYAYARLDAALALMIIGAGIEFNDYREVRRIIDEQLSAMRHGDISEQEMSFTLKAFKNDILSEQDSPGQLVGRQLERILIGGGLFGRELLAALERVQIDDIRQVAQGVALDTAYFLTEDGTGGAEA